MTAEHLNLRAAYIENAQQLKSLKKIKEDQDRFMNNQKFTIKNLEFESRKKVQELNDKM